MSKSFSRSVRHAGLISALVMAPCLAINAGVVSAETIKAQLATAPNVPPPITRTQPATVLVNLEANEWVGPLSNDNNYEFWGFNKTVPGPMIRVMLGDTVEIRLKNHKDSKESHNIDFHAITGPGGGASLLKAAKAWAWLAGRDYVTPDEVKAVALPALRHRLLLRPELVLEGVTADGVLQNILATVPAPR